MYLSCLKGAVELKAGDKKSVAAQVEGERLKVEGS